jgi:F-type H+-transporting ATPase subunit epsilon
MDIQIITPDQTVFAGEVKLAQFPGLDGSFEVLQKHAPMIAALKKGRIKLRTPDDKDHFFEIKAGVLEVVKDKLLVLAG